MANRQARTPTKEGRELKGSSLNCRGRSQTGKKKSEQTPRNTHSVRKSALPLSLTKDANSSSKQLREEEAEVPRSSTEKLEGSREKEARARGRQESSQVVRERTVNKYARLFELSEKGRPVRWPHNLLERTIEEIYDDLFTRNTQCLQNRNIGHALRALTQLSFPQLVEGFFRKKFKGSRLAATNLNNMLYTLSHATARDGCPVFVRTFEGFLLAEWQHEDLLYYLFARNVLKRELRTAEKARDLGRAEGCYFTESLKGRDVSKCLLGIIGRDPELISEYRGLLAKQVAGEQMAAYEFLRVLLEDYHCKRVGNRLSLAPESLGHTLFEKDNSYDCRNNTEELTFGEEHESQRESLLERCSEFWACQEYSRIRDSLFELIMEKMAQKVVELVELLANDIEAPAHMLQALEQLMLRKAESLVKAVFEMNKMKWFKELAILQPTEEDISAVETVQIRLRELRCSPSGREIGEFCKTILTTKALIN